MTRDRMTQTSLQTGLSLLVGLVTLASSGASAQPSLVKPSQQPTCASFMFAEETLHFSLAKPSGGVVTEAEWQTFVEQTVKPKSAHIFLHILDTSKTANLSSGQAVPAPSRAFMLVYPSRAVEEDAIAHIIATYQRQFQIKSVSRTTTCVTISW